MRCHQSPGQEQEQSATMPSIQHAWLTLYSPSVFTASRSPDTHRITGRLHVRLRLKLTLIQTLLTAQPGMKEEECFVYPTLVTLTSYYSRLLPRHTSANNGYIPLKWLVKFTSAIIKQICKNYCSTFSG